MRGAASTLQPVFDDRTLPPTVKPERFRLQFPDVLASNTDDTQIQHASELDGAAR